jgi:hypothetical protein
MTRIHQVLNEKGLQQIQTAEFLGVAISPVSHPCSNTVHKPLSKLNKIADAIGWDVTDLIVSKKKSKD